MIAEDDATTERSAEKTDRANLALRRLAESLLAAWNAWNEAPEDDHKAGKTAQLDAAIAQGDAFGVFMDALSELAPDGIKDMPLHELAIPLRVLLTQARELKAGHVGPLLLQADRPEGRPQLLLAVRLRRARTIAAWQIYEMSGVSTKEAIEKVVNILSDATSTWGKHAADPQNVLRQWEKELREAGNTALEAVYCCDLVAEAQHRFDTDKFDEFQLRDYAELLLRQWWP